MILSILSIVGFKVADIFRFVKKEAKRAIIRWIRRDRMPPLGMVQRNDETRK